ncbi:MAG: four helix bundle protein [Flavobacteriales bacterium]
MNNFKELKVWKKAIELAVLVYKTTKQFPADERFGLISQINRCSVSVSSNIAEGAGRNNKKEFRHFLGIAQGSCYELESQLILSNLLEFVTDERLKELEPIINEVNRMIHGLKKSLD